MSVIDNFINSMKFNNDPEDEYDDEFGDLEEGYDDEDVEEEAPRPLFGRKRAAAQEEYPAPARRTSLAGSNAPAVAPVKRGGSTGGGNMQVRIIKPSSFDQCRQIADTLLSHRTVLLNLEGLDVNTAQRIVDFASGSCYALHGNFMKISHFIIVITPEDVDIAGDINMDGGDNILGALASSTMQQEGGMFGTFNTGAAPSVPFMN